MDRNKAVVAHLMERISASDIDGAIDTLAEDGRWWVGGKTPEFPLAGYKSREDMRTLLNDLINPMPNGLKMTIKSMIAENDRVAAEVESYGEAGNGRLYNNEYHFLFILREGLIVEAKEYLDTMHTADVFLRP